MLKLRKGRVKAGEASPFKLSGRDKNVREIKCEVRGKFSVKMDNRTVNSNSANSSELTDRVTPILDGERSLSLSSGGKNRERPITVPYKCAPQKLSKKNSKEHDRGKLTDSKNGKTNLRFAGRVRANNKSERNRNVQTSASSNTAARQAASSSSSSGHDIPTTPKLTSERHSAPSAENTWIETISPRNGRERAGEIMSFKLNSRDKNALPTDGEINKCRVNVLPSNPDCLRKVTYSVESPPQDPSFLPDNQTLYHNVWTIFEAEILDKFGSVVTNANVVGVSSNTCDIRFDTYSVTNGKLKIRMKTCQLLVTSAEIVIQFKCDDCPDEIVLKKEIQVCHPPCSSMLSQVTSNKEVCIAGEEYHYLITIKDVFNNQVPKGARIDCIVHAWSSERHFRTEEYVICNSDVVHLKENEGHDKCLRLDLVIIPKRVGSRQIFVHLNGAKINTTDIQFDVLPNLYRLRCKSISRLQSEGKPATLEVSIEDCSGNSVSLGEGGLRLVQESGPPNSLTCQRTEVQSNMVLIEHELKHNEHYLLSLEKSDVTGLSTLIPKFEVDTHSDVLQSNDPKGKKFLLYNDNMCQIIKVRGKWSGIECKGTTARTIKGPDYANLKNIKRALNFRGRIDLNEIKSRRETTRTEIIFCTNVSEEFLETCREVVLHLLRGTHYRKKASESGKHRCYWKDRIERLIGNFPKFSNPYRDPESMQSIPRIPRKYISKRDTYGDLMNQYNRQACEEFFAFFNYEREENEVDLHGLLVADEQNYANLRKNLKHKKLNDLTIEKVVSRSRWEGDEAIRKLESKLESFDFEAAVKNEKPWIEIVVGAGHHSRENQKIRPKVERFLQERSMDFAALNKGSLVVTLKKYNGPEPCIAEYYCKECDRCWESSRSWSNTPQACKKCKGRKGKNVECFPLKQRAQKNPSRVRSRARNRNRTKKKHQEDLCKKCQTLGHLCYKS